MSNGDRLELGLMVLSLVASGAMIARIADAVWFALLTCG
jgi:hypothetical protein